MALGTPKTVVMEAFSHDTSQLDVSLFGQHCLWERIKACYVLADICNARTEYGLNRRCGQIGRALSPVSGG